MNTIIPTINLQQTGANIKMLRQSSGIKINQMQAALGFSTPQAIYKWQRGDTLPSLDNLVILSAIFNCRIDDILAVQ